MINDVMTAERIGIKKKCGFWGINGNYFFDKFECLKYASSIKSYDIKFHYYDSVYTALDWSKEPTESLESLYKDRAQQIRDEYDYLILSFSGGADSNNILRTFIDNNIKLDEVYCEYPIETLEKLKPHFIPNTEDPQLLEFEWFTAAQPLLKKLSISNPEIKITIDSGTEETIQIVKSEELHKYKRGGVINPKILYHGYNLYKVAKERTKHGRVACINGSDKPSIFYNDLKKQFFVVYPDFLNMHSNFSNNIFSEYEYQISMENFYITCTYPKLNQKMAFVLKNNLIELIQHDTINNTNYNSLLWNNESDYSNKLNNIHIYNTHKDFFKKILYKTFDSTIWQAGKANNMGFYWSACNWFFDRSITDDRTRDFYDKQIVELVHGIDHNLLSYKNGKPSKLKTYHSESIAF
jgi:hypothetical protein